MAKGLPRSIPKVYERLEALEQGAVTVEADAESGLEAADSVQELAVALSARIKALEDAA